MIKKICLIALTTTLFLGLPAIDGIAAPTPPGKGMWGTLGKANLGLSLGKALSGIPTKEAKKHWKRGQHYLSGVQYNVIRNVTLSDGTVVHFFPQATDSPSVESHRYYYLPAAPRIAKHSDGTPRFSMIKFVTDETEKEGGLDGAILDFAVTYSLDDRQRREAERLLKRQDRKARVLGILPLEPVKEGDSFAITSAVLHDKEFTPTLVHSGSAPVLEGGMVSVSARLNAYAATLLEKSFSMPASNVHVEFRMRYITRLPPYRVQATVDFDRYRELYSAYLHRRDKGSRRKWDPKWWNIFHTKNINTLNEREATQILDLLQESGVVKIFIDEPIPNADKNNVMTGLLQLVMEQFTTMLAQMPSMDTQEGQAETESGSGEDDEDEESVEEQRRKEAAKYDHYRYKRSTRVQKRFTGKYTLNLKKVGARYSELTLVGNLSTWYQELRRHPKLFAEVKLDDPFFARRTIHIVIDGETYDIFSKVVNYATVQVLPHSGRYPLEKTIDRAYIEKHGQTATITYAPTGKSWDYRYAVQWSLRGGHLFPSRPRWKKGESQGITLEAPLKPVTVEMEADPEELTGLGVTRVAMELRFRQFGKDRIQHNAAAISMIKGEPLVAATVYPDKESEDLRYRLIYFHKKLGKISERRWKKVEGNYVYCAPTSSLLEKITGE